MLDWIDACWIGSGAVGGGLPLHDALHRVTVVRCGVWVVGVIAMRGGAARRSVRDASHDAIGIRDVCEATCGR